MDYKSFIVKYYSDMPKEDKIRVSGYFPAIASSRLSTMKPLDGIDMPINSACVGFDTDEYLRCFIDAVTLAKGKDSVVIMESTKVLASMMGNRSYSVDDISVVLGNLGYSPVDIQKEDYTEDYEVVLDDEEDDEDGSQWSDNGEEWVPGDVTSIEYGVEATGGTNESCKVVVGATVVPQTDTDNLVEGTDTQQKCLADDVPQEDDSSESCSDEDNSDLDREIVRCFGNTIPNYVSKLLNTYDLMYSSGYELKRPYGVLGSEGVYFVDEKNHCAVRASRNDMDFSTSIKMYSLFQGVLGFSEKSCRSHGMVGLEIVKQFNSNPSKPLYFPMKALEIMFGRVPATSKKEYNGDKIIYFSRSPNMNSWSKYKNNDLKQHLTKLLLQCVKYYLQSSGYSHDIRSLEVVNAVNGLLSFAVSCLSVGILIIDYRSSNGLPVKFKIRVTDPLNKLGRDNYTDVIIRNVFSDNSGGLDSKSTESGLNKKLSADYRVYEYAHEFNHRLSNATPLFAYKALEALQARGESPNWDTAIIGQAMDDTILRNGSGGINLASTLFHHINAGTRSGKGVMTLNMLASGIASGKALFYLDNKVDMGSMLSSLSHSGAQREYPEMFVVNGSNFEKDDFHEFTNRNNWVIQEHIPQEVRTLFGSSSWETLGDLFYLRAYMLCLGIIFARGSDSNGKANDPNFGGSNGLMIVVDEINQVQTRMLEKATIMADVVPPLDSEYQNRLDDIRSTAEDEKKAAKVPKLIRSFKRQFNGAAYYALSLLKSYADCIQSIKNKSFSGFKDSEARASDIFVIGQNLEPIPVGDLNDILKTCRYKNDSDVGLNKMSNGGNRVRTQSIPYQMTLFKSADAFIGYNGSQPEYLKQGDTDSKAHGILDRIARGFAYIPRFDAVKDGEKPAYQFCSKERANDPSTVYFKPYLILNKSDMDSSYVQEMFGYAYAEGAGATKEQIISEYPDKDDHSRLSRNVGFIEYMTMMGLKDLPGRLRKGADVANHVISKYLGYQGEPGSRIPLWLQFITDMRVEWMFSPQDVWALCTGNSEYNLGKGIDSKITGEYYQYARDVADLMASDIDISDSTLSASAVFGDGSFSEEDVEEFETRAGFFSKEDGSDNEWEAEEESVRLSEAIGDFASIDGNLFIDDDSDCSEYDSGILNFRSGSSTSPELITKTNSGNSGGSSSNEFISEAISSANMSAVEEALKTLKENGYNVSVDMGSYSVNTSGEMKVDFVPASERSDMGSIFSDVKKVNSSDSVDDFQSIVDSITKKVIQDYGGLSRINSFAIVGDSLVLNRVMYRCHIGKDVSSKLYVDLRREINAGNIIRVFNYKVLTGMENLTELKCDSASFMYDFVNYSTFGSSDVPVRAYFEAFQRLNLLQIGDKRYTRKSVYEDEEANPFYIQTKCSKFFDNVHDASKKVNKSVWSWGKSKFTNKQSRWYQKVLWSPVVVSAVCASAVARGTSAGVSSAKTAIDKSRAKKGHESKVEGLVNNFKSGLSAVKSSMKDIFGEE